MSSLLWCPLTPQSFPRTCSRRERGAFVGVGRGGAAANLSSGGYEGLLAQFLRQRSAKVGEGERFLGVMGGLEHLQEDVDIAYAQEDDAEGDSGACGWLAVSV